MMAIDGNRSLEEMRVTSTFSSHTSLSPFSYTLDLDLLDLSNGRSGDVIRKDCRKVLAACGPSSIEKGLMHQSGELRHTSISIDA